MAELVGSDVDLLDNRWMRVVERRTVSAEVDEVWTLVGDSSRWLDWYRPLSTFEAVGPVTSGLGAIFVEHEWLWKTTSEVVVWEERQRIDLATRSINLRGLLAGHYRSITLQPGCGDGAVVTIAGGFRLGPLGWLLFPYTYPQVLISLYFEYRSALEGLDLALAV